jgi:hypothetical protein
LRVVVTLRADPAWVAAGEDGPEDVEPVGVGEPRMGSPIAASP